MDNSPGTTIPGTTTPGTTAHGTTPLGTVTLGTTTPGTTTPGNSYPGDNYPPEQLPTRVTTPPIITHQDNYPPRTITPVGQLLLRAITPTGKALGIISNTLPSLTENSSGRIFHILFVVIFSNHRKCIFAKISTSLFSNVTCQI